MMRFILFVACVLPLFAVHSQGRRAAQAAALEAQLETAEAQAIAGATRPGDESLTCDQLQTEMVTIAQSSEIREGLAPFAGQAQADQAQIAEAQQELTESTRAPRGGGRLRGMAQGLATAAAPNSVGAAAQMAAATAQAAQAQAQAEQRQQQIFGQAPQLVAMMGPAMRGQRLIELAEAKKCEWLQGDPLSAPNATPEPPAERERR